MTERIRQSSQQIITFLSGRISLGIALGLVVSAACLWVFAELADEITENEFLALLDLVIANYVHDRVHPTTIPVFLFITLFGSQVVWGLSVIVGLYYARLKQWFSLLIWIIALGGGSLLNALLKLWFARPRPVFESPIVIEQFYSFPSGHAMTSMIAYGILTYFVLLKLKNRVGRVVVVITAALIILMVGFSRIYLGVHYLSDVLAGFAAGGVWLITCIMIREFVDRKLTTASKNDPSNSDTQPI